MKFTFKTVKSTGRYRSFYPDSHYIKFNKMEVGTIGDNPPHKIRLMVMKSDEKDNSNCDWKWVTLKKEFTSLDDAKKWLNENITAIFEKFPIKIKE